LVRFSTLLFITAVLTPAALHAQVPVPTPPPLPPPVAQPGDSSNPFALDLRTRIESKLERNQNERCTAGQSLVSFTNCRGGFQPIFGVEFHILSTGTLAERFNVNLDFDSEREFDASNNISLYYQGKSNELLTRLEVGNVSFTPPPSRFITNGIPSGNYGIQAIGNIGGARLSLVAAQQKGNVKKADAFTLGDRTLQTSQTRIDDFRFEGRRFFFTIDPAQLGGYPNIDILDTQRMLELAALLPDSIRPTRIHIYRLLIGGQPRNPNGPQFIPRGARNANRGPVYDYLREGEDYYADPSRLWISLVRPLGRNERLVVAYNVQMPGGVTVNPTTGGTPDLEFRPDAQYANLLWDSEVTPGDPVFNREIRAAYRIGGDELDRASLDVKIVTGTSGDQEKPLAGNADTYLQRFGIAAPHNSARLDTENRLWPRRTDANYNIAATGSQKLIRDYFLIFPSLEPFSRRGLAIAGNPANDTLYTTPDEDITSPRRPQPVYRLDTKYASEGVGGSGTIALQSLQLRRNSERVEIDGVQLVRDRDYTIDYDLGRITLNRPDTLYLRPRQLTVHYEEMPLFAEKPTNIFAASTEFPMENGSFAITAISQRQTSTFSRPTLGNESASSLIAGMSGRFRWDATSVLTRGLQSFMTTTAPSHIAVQGEIAASRPDPNSENRAFLESFEGEGGISVALADPRWYFSSRPIASPALPDALTELPRASTMVWQNTGASANGGLITFTLPEIDPLTKLIGSAFSSVEPVLWLSLLPLSDGGTRDAAGNPSWLIGNTPTGRRWRSLRTVLSPSGVDLTRVEHVEMWVLIDTTVVGRRKNPTLVVDLGDVSENSIAFSPDTLILDRTGTAPVIAGYRGKTFQRLDTLDSERDSFTKTFDASVNDIGLPGDRARSIRVRDANSGLTTDSLNVAVCRADRTSRRLGDSRINCTVRNDRLDEEDIDLDNVLNFPRESERILRFPIDLSDPDNYTRIGGRVSATDPRNRSGVPLHWVKIRIPIAAPEANGIEEPLLRRVKTLRLTVVSSADTPDDAMIDLPISGLKLAGAPWVKRSDAPITGIGGDPGSAGAAKPGYVIATLIGTQDSTSNIPYQPPPGVIEQADNRNTGFVPGQIQINERSMRLLAGGLGVNDRAEAYYRFPEGQKSFMGYQQLRVWARGRGDGWGTGGGLQFFVKIGRDADNFYLYRTPVNAGNTQNAWEPEIRVDFNRFFALKAKIQAALYSGTTETIQSCTAADSALILASLTPPTATGLRYAACDGGYMVYSVDPAVSPPDLASVQELAVGIIRVAPGTLPVPTLPSDTLELWIDDIRLTGVVNAPGYAGHVGIDFAAADFVDFRGNLSRRDRDFRQLAEQPTFNTQDAVDLVSTVQLGKLIPMLGLSAPLTINHRSAGSDPYFMSSSDVLADGVPGLRTPRSSATSYALTLRRSTPLENSRYGVLFNNLSLSSTYASTGARSEYQDSRSSNFTVGLDYNIAADPKAVRLPGWLDRAVSILPDWLLRTPPLAAFRNGEYHYSPTQFRITSALAHAADHRTSFTTPAASPTDTGRRVDGLNFVWRNGAAIELVPARALRLRVDAMSLRDLRNYEANAADRARVNFLGQDIGLERERALRSSISFTPTIAAWIRPNLSFGSDFTMTQDPNARTLVRGADPLDEGRLPRRISGTQSFGAGATIDVEAGLVRYLGRIPKMDVFAKIFTPADINYTRSLLSSFDRVAGMAPLGYQFGLGSIGDFRSQNGEQAITTGLTNALTVANTVVLPLGVSLQNRFQRTDTRNWTRRLANQESVIDGAQRTFPDVSLLWNWRPPTSIAPFVSSVGGRAGYRRIVRSTLAPPFAAGADIDRTWDRSLNYPLNLSLTWGFLGGFTTAGSYNVTLTKSERPGSIANGRSHDYGGEISKTFAPNRAWRLPGDLRTHVGFQRTQAEPRVASTTPNSISSRLTDNGRYTFNLGADTDVSETVSFSLTGARTVTFDHNFNRRFTQTVISAVLNLQFFGGSLR
jgi:cell surface protein SprA